MDDRWLECRACRRWEITGQLESDLHVCRRRHVGSERLKNTPEGLQLLLVGTGAAEVCLNLGEVAVGRAARRWRAAGGAQQHREDALVGLLQLLGAGKCHPCLATERGRDALLHLAAEALGCKRASARPALLQQCVPARAGRLGLHLSRFALLGLEALSNRVIASLFTPRNIHTTRPPLPADPPAPSECPPGALAAAKRPVDHCCGGPMWRGSQAHSSLPLISRLRVYSFRGGLAGGVDRPRRRARNLTTA